MVDGNHTKTVTEFIFIGFQNLLIINPLLFMLFFTIYVLTLFGNLFIIFLVAVVPSLKSPMYFFLTQLSLSDILLTTNISPNLLQIIDERRTISLSGCITQYYFNGVSAATECLLLTVMSYDRYLAICKPLHYISIMNLKLQLQLTFICWSSTCMLSFFLAGLVSNLRFCGPYIIHHYFCDIVPILELTCSNRSFIDLVNFYLTILFAPFPFSFILVTYILILITISKMSSTTGKQKAFSTCSSHLIVVSMYYGTLITLYMTHSKGQSYHVNTSISLIYNIGIPFCNPIIYSLRNQEIKAAVKTHIQLIKKTFKLQ